MFGSVAAEPPALSHCLRKQTTGDKNINEQRFYRINYLERYRNTILNRARSEGLRLTRFCRVWDGRCMGGVKQRSSLIISSSTYINRISQNHIKKVSILSLFYFSPPDNIIPLSHSHRLAAFIRFLHHTDPPAPSPSCHSV